MVPPDQQLAGVGGTGPGDPHAVQDVVKVGAGQVDVVLGHPVGHLPEVAADMGQGCAIAQQIRGDGVPGLMRDVVADVEGIGPGAKPFPEPGVGQGRRPVQVADLAGEQGQRSAFGSGRSTAVACGESVRGLALTFGEDLVEVFGNADRDVQIADLSLVVPEHVQAAVAANAVQSDLDYFADPPPGARNRLPDVEGAQLDAGPAKIIDRPPALGTVHRPHQLSQVIPEQVTQPALRHLGDVDVAGPAGKPHAEVAGLDEACLPGAGRGEVDQPEKMQHHPHDPRIAGGEVRRIEVGQRVQAAVPAVVRQLLELARFPLAVPLLSGMDAQGPLNFGGPEPSGLRTSSRVHPEGLGVHGLARKRISRLSSATRRPGRLWIIHDPLHRWRAESG